MAATRGPIVLGGHPVPSNVLQRIEMAEGETLRKRGLRPVRFPGNLPLLRMRTRCAQPPSAGVRSQ